MWFGNIVLSLYFNLFKQEFHQNLEISDESTSITLEAATV
jgi:hypothetical protein